MVWSGRVNPTQHYLQDNIMYNYTAKLSCKYRSIYVYFIWLFLILNQFILRSPLIQTVVSSSDRIVVQSPVFYEEEEELGPIHFLGGRRATASTRRVSCSRCESQWPVSTPSDGRYSWQCSYNYHDVLFPGVSKQEDEKDESGSLFSTNSYFRQKSL